MDADVVIVGTGVAGALIGWRLATAGVTVLMLEAGPQVDRNAAVNRARAAVAQTPGRPYENPPWAERPDFADGLAYYDQTGPQPFSSTYERVVGGTTWHWLGSMIRLLPADFAMRTTYGVGVDWPLTYDELEPWYLEGERQLGVSGDPAHDLGSPRSAPYPLPPIPVSYSDQHVAKAAASLGWRVDPTPQARNSQPFQGRPQCCGNAYCIPICPIQAKYDATVHVKLAQAAGAQVVENAVVHRVDVDAEGKVSALRYLRPDRSEATVTGGRYLIAANAIETAKLLLISRTDALPDGVANRSGKVGRHLADHPVKLSIALAKEPVYPLRGPLSTAGIEQLRNVPERASRSAFRVEIGNDGWSWPGLDPLGIASALIDAGAFGPDLFNAVAPAAANQLRFSSLCEQLPDEESRVTVDPAVTDPLGIPRPVLHYRVQPYTDAGLAAAEQALDHLFDALGVTYRHHFPGFYGAGHLMGTHRMGTDPADSVTDPDGRTHDHPNLWLAGCGLFPTTGTANPTATVAALSLRTADALLRELGVATPVASPAATPVAS